jgi:hypothetical protein
MRTKAIAIITLAALLLSVVPAFGVINTNPDPSVDISPPWQYTTTDFAISTYDPSVDILSADKWDDDTQQTPNYFVNLADTINGASPGIPTDAEYLTFIRAAADLWVNDLDQDTDFLPILTYAGPTTEKPSQFFDKCGSESGTLQFDGVNEVGFCDHSVRGEVRLHPSARTTPGVSDNIDEFDIIFDSSIAWKNWGAGGQLTQDDMQATATHEFGHVFGLGDVYDFYPNATDPCVAFADAKEDPTPVMCDGFRTLGVADKNGIKQMYAEPQFNDLTQTSTSWTVDGSDIALALVNTTSSNNNSYDLIQVFAEHDSTNSNIRAEFEWDLDSTGDGGSGTAVALISGITGRVQDVGAAFDNIDGDGFPDLVVVYTVESPADTFKTYYKIFSDIKRSSTSSFSAFTTGSTFGGTFGTQITSAANGEGIDVVLWDYDGNNVKDIIVVTTKLDASGDWRMYYYYTTVTNTFAVGSWISGADGGDYITNEDGIGATMYDKSKRLLAVNYNRFSSMDVNLFHFAGTTLTTIDHFLEKWGPLEDTPVEESAGAAEAINIGGEPNQSFPEMIYAYEDDDNMYWQIEWDSRLNSHP